MGVKGFIGNALKGLSSTHAAAYIDRGAGKSAKYLAKGRQLMDAGVLKPAYKPGLGPISASRAEAETIRDFAIRKRQFQVGRRYAAGAAAVGTYTAAKPNANQSRTSYRGPMQTGRGVGRYS